MNMGVFPSGQWGQTVNLLLSASVVRIHPRPPKNQRRKYAGFCFIRYLKFHSQGWIRTAAATSLKTAQKQPSATATTAASGRSREELLGLRPAGCACRPRHDAAAGSRDPGSFLFCAARDIHPRPQKPQRITLHSPFPVSSLPQGRLALQGNKKKDALRSLAKRLCL